MSTALDLALRLVATLRDLLVATPIGGRGVVAVTWCVALVLGGYLWARWSCARRTAR